MPIVLPPVVLALCFRLCVSDWGPGAAWWLGLGALGVAWGSGLGLGVLGGPVAVLELSFFLL